MTPSPMVKKARPLSPHLQIYRPQMTSGMSIFHRMTGIALAFGLPLFVVWLYAVACGPHVYFDFASLMNTLIGQIILFGLTFSFFYHFCCGIRHLLWDAGYFLTLPGVYSTGRIAIAVSVLLTVGIWIKAYGMTP